MIRLLTFALIALPIVALAQDEPPPVDTTLFLGAITAITPFVLFIVKQIVPRVPKWALPFAAPLVGASVEIVSDALGGPNASAMQAAFYGALGVWLREALDQLRKRIEEGEPRPAG